LLEILNNCIPPTFIIGINVIAITIIPIPPSHCRIALQTKIDFGAVSRFTIIVEPVVVIPDILSKKASVIVKLSSEKIKGRDPKVAILSHARAVSKKACCKFNILSCLKFDSKNKVPNIIVIIAEMKKEESISLKINCAIIGMIIDTPRIICKIPKVKKTVL
tara:strand:+ start:268 stop:753 length:486 start_codon:yes stop_codon:yes gene_type:complete